MHLKKSDLHEEEDNFTDGEKTDYTCRKECSERCITETQTDVKTAIRHLPKHYFKEIATNTNICLENTQSGLKTIVGRIQRVKRKRETVRKKTERSHTLLISICVIVGMTVISFLAYFLVSSLLSCYETGSSTGVEAKP